MDDLKQPERIRIADLKVTQPSRNIKSKANLHILIALHDIHSTSAQFVALCIFQCMSQTINDFALSSHQLNIPVIVTVLNSLATVYISGSCTGGMFSGAGVLGVMPLFTTCCGVSTALIGAS